MIAPTVQRGAKHFRPGFLLLEALLAIALFGLFLTAVGLTLLRGQEGTIAGGNRVRAASVATEALEVARAVRDTAFAGLSGGSHGIAQNASRQWIFSGTQSTRSGGYLVSATITQLATNWVSVEANTKWKHGYTRSGSVVLTTELTDWRGGIYAGDWSSAVLDGSYVDAGTPSFNDAAVAGNYAYVTSETSTGGAGLYVFDISQTTSPTRVAATFSLGAAGYDVAIKGRTLYIVTADPAMELQVYDISSPTTLSVSNRIASRNLSGSSLATSLALRGPTLFIGSQNDSTFHELAALDVSNTGALVWRDSLDGTATVSAIVLTGTSALLSTSDTAGEMKVVGAADPSNLFYPLSSDNNVSGTEIGRSIAATGTAALLGRQKGSIQELVVFHTQYGVNGPPGPWYHEGSGSLVGVDADPAKCYAFLAADSSIKAFQVADLRDGAIPELTTYNSTSGPARGLRYDIIRDRVYLLTRKAFLIFRPGSAAGPCS